VYNHTNEGDDAFSYTTSFKGIDCSVRPQSSPRVGTVAHPLPPVAEAGAWRSHSEALPALCTGKARRRVRWCGLLHVQVYYILDLDQYVQLTNYSWMRSPASTCCLIH